MTFVLALETPNGAITTFTSTAPGKLTPTVNGRVLSVAFTRLSTVQVCFDVPPDIGDVVGFFVEPV